MRSLKSLLVAATALVGVPSLAQAQWYVGADVGAVQVQDADVSGSSLSHGTDYELGYALLGQVGYSYGNGLKSELELGWRQSDVDSVGGQTGGGDVSALSIMGNVIYDFMPQSKWHPFIGAGIGAAQLNSDSVTKSGTSAYSGDDWQFAYQGLAGVGYDLDSNWALKAQYRYFSTLDYSVSSSTNVGMDAEYQSHAVTVGFTYSFGAPAPVPAPMPVAAPAPAPAPVKKAPAPRNFMVFFDFDKTAITPEAAAIIKQAAGAAKTGTVARVDLTGHADRSGSDKYNLALSQKRADAVRAQLVAMGIPAEQIQVVAKGESVPLVSTPDGVREPQNRRVEIVLP